MLESYFSASKMLGYLRSGPSGPYLDGFAAALERQGYSAGAAVRYLRAAAHLGHVVARQGAMPSDIDLAVFSEHLRACRCPRAMGGRLNHHTIFGARLFRQHLVEIGVCRSAAGALQHAEPCLVDKALVYALLMRAAAEAMIALAAKRLRAKIGLLAVLHTWGQRLTHHPHVHCVVPGGGVSLDGKRWIACKPGFFLPVKALARTFRRSFLAGLEAAFDKGALRFFGELAPLAERRAFAARVRSLRKIDWVVYAKPPFGGPSQVLAYLARYTHRAAIANSRLVEITDDEVAFAYKDYRRNGRRGIMPSRRMSLFVVFCCTCFPTVFTASVITASWPGETATKSSNSVANSPVWIIPTIRTPGSASKNPPSTPPSLVQTAADSCGAAPPSRPSGRVLSGATRHEPGNPLPFNHVVPLAVAALPTREAPLRVAISFSDGLCHRKAAAPSFPTKLPKAALPILDINFHGERCDAPAAKPRRPALSP
jgi:hypothetical protein